MRESSHRADREGAKGEKMEGFFFAKGQPLPPEGRRVCVRSSRSWPVVVVTSFQVWVNKNERAIMRTLLEDHRSLLLFLIVFCRNAFPLFASDVQLFEYGEPAKCRSDEFFDASNFSCATCDATKHLEPSVDRSTCVCDRYSRIVGFKDGRVVCNFCGPNATASADGRSCVGCSDASCKCAANEKRIEENSSNASLPMMRCLPCPDDSYVSNDGTECLPCDSSRDGLGTCVCPQMSHVRIRNLCLRKDDFVELPQLKNTYLVEFEKISVDSFYLRENLQRSLYLCKKRDRASCEHLSHMCLLTLLENSIVCSLYVQTNTYRPDLFYAKESFLEVLDGRCIPKRYSLDQNNDDSTLNFTFATFSLQGDFMSLDKPGMPCNFLSNVRFGVNLKTSCNVVPTDLLKFDVEFYTPYLTFNEGHSTFLHSSPVLIANINAKHLLRKLFLLDNISGFEALTNIMDNTYKKDSNLSVLRYIKSLNVLVTVQNENDYGKIYPPLFVVEYAEISKEQMRKTDFITIDYEVKFVLKHGKINTYIEISLGTLASIAFVFSAIKSWNYCRRNDSINVSMLFWFIIYVFGAIGNVLLLIALTLCAYTFILYKCQTVPQVLLPDEDSEQSIWICGITAFCFKLVEMSGFIYNLWNMEIFFIDWEQPRTIKPRFTYDSPHTSLKKSYSRKFKHEEFKEAPTPSEIIAAKRNQFSKKQSHKNKKKLPPLRSTANLSIYESNEEENIPVLPVSIWRTYFIANEWLKLQTVRRVDIFLQAIYILFLLEIVGLKHWSLSTPELMLNNENPEIKISFPLEVGLCSLIYVSVYFTQYLISVLFYERYIKNQIQEFIDLCPLTNISVFILIFKNHGFYIHGRSAHGFADVDLYTLINNLEAEERDICAHRGLLPGTAEQTFILSVTPSFRKLYDDIFKKENRINRFSKNKLCVEEVMDRRLKVNQFLCQYLDHCFKKEDYIIKEQNFFEKLCDIMLYKAKEKSIFYNDNGHSFDNTLIYGNEWLFFSFEISTFIFMLIQSKNYIFALIIHVLIAKLLTSIIRYNGKRNICKKSILDNRFLM